MAAFLTSPLVVSPSPNNLLQLHSTSTRSTITSTAVKVPRTRRRAPRHYDVTAKPRDTKQSGSPDRPTPISFYSNSAIALPNLKLLTMPHELKTHKILSCLEEHTLTTHIRFLREIEDAMKDLEYQKEQQRLNEDAQFKENEISSSPKCNNNITVNEIANYFQISEEEVEKRRRLGIQARNQLVTFNVRLASSIAASIYEKKVKKGSKIRSKTAVVLNSNELRSELTGTTISDMVQEACIALIRAAERFDPTKGTKFSTYASRAIYTSCLRSAVPITCIVPLPERLRRAIGRPKGLVKNFEYLPEHLVEMAREHINSGVSLDEKLNTGLQHQFGRHFSKKDLLVCYRSQPADVVERDVFIKELRTLCYEVLTQQQADTIVLKFGLNGQNPMSTKDIAILYGKSVSRIGQILSSARETLRETVPSIL